MAPWDYPLYPDNPYVENYSVDELNGMLDHPEEIETGCENNCDTCIEEQIKLIEEAISILTKESI